MNDIKRRFLNGAIGLNTAMHKIAARLGIDTDEAMEIVKAWDDVYRAGEGEGAQSINITIRNTGAGSANAPGATVNARDITGKGG